MRKVRLIAVLTMVWVFVAVNIAFAGGAVKLGVDFNNDHEISGYGGSASMDVDPMISFTGEFYAGISSNLDIGGGLTLQLPRTAEFMGLEGEFYFLPIYGAMRFKSASESVAPYGILQLGYNFFDGNDAYKGSADLDGGIYYGVGGGLIIKKHFLIELLYSVNNGEVSEMGYSFDIENSQITLNFGFNF